jgi:hypothetical protein
MYLKIFLFHPFFKIPLYFDLLTEPFFSHLTHSSFLLLLHHYFLFIFSFTVCSFLPWFLFLLPSFPLALVSFFLFYLFFLSFFPSISLSDCCFPLLHFPFIFFLSACVGMAKLRKWLQWAERPSPHLKGRAGLYTSWPYPDRLRGFHSGQVINTLFYLSAIAFCWTYFHGNAHCWHWKRMTSLLWERVYLPLTIIAWLLNCEMLAPELMWVVPTAILISNSAFKFSKNANLFQISKCYCFHPLPHLISWDWTFL